MNLIWLIIMLDLRPLSSSFTDLVTISKLLRFAQTTFILSKLTHRPRMRIATNIWAYLADIITLAPRFTFLCVYLIP